MYWVEVLRLLVMHTSIPYNPAYLISSLIWGYYQIMSECLQCCLLVIWRTTLWWNLPSARTVRGDTTHISDPKRRMAWTTALKNVSGIHASEPYFTMIHETQAHFLQ